MQSVATKQKNVPGEYLVVVDVDADKQPAAQGTAQHMAAIRLGGLLGREQSEPFVLAGHGVVASERGNPSLTDQIASRIPHLSNKEMLTEKCRRRARRPRDGRPAPG